ncbi:MAG: heme exporter protein CcmB [Chloroflexaceae bacterium]
MTPSLQALLTAAWAVFVKDLRSELRTRYALNAMLLFAASSAVAVSLGAQFLGTQQNVEPLQAALLWIALLFAALNGLSRSFVQEEETRTALALRLASPPIAIYLGKLLFNLILLAALDTVTSLLFIMFVGVAIGNVGLFVTLLALGSLCLTTATTILAAIIAKANFKSALFAVLAFPLFIPPLILVIRGTALALTGASWGDGASFLQALSSYAVVTFVASLFLFRTVWES